MSRNSVSRAVVPALIAALALALLILAGCRSTPAGMEAGAAAANLSGIEQLAEYKGDVLVLLMGMPGCLGTERAMEFLPAFDKKKPEGVSVLRLDVPPAGKTIETPRNLPAGFPYAVDAGRSAADGLDFFYYPTLYIFDRDGELRFRGGCDEENVAEIVAALLAEAPGAKKRSFTPATPTAGDRAAGFTGTTTGGESVTLDGLRGEAATLLVFSSITCPYSKKAMEDMPGLVSEFGPKGASFVIVDPAESAGAIKGFYASKAPGVPVLVDSSREISVAKYGVRTVPYFYVIDADGMVAGKMPFSAEAARAALESVLGMSSEPVRVKASGAG